MKKCTRCFKIKPLNEFGYRNRKTDDNYKIRQQYLESCSYLKENYFVNLERD